MYAKPGLLSNDGNSNLAHAARLLLPGRRLAPWGLFGRGDLLPQTFRSGGAYLLDSVGGAEGGG